MKVHTFIWNDQQIPPGPQDPSEHPENILENPANILRTSREHLENIKRTSIEYLENIKKDLWSSENIFEYLITSEFILNTSENFYRIFVINWGPPEKKCLQRGWSSIKLPTQLKTSENSWEHRRTSEIIWYHPENNWGPIIDTLVQLEEDFNSRTEKWSGGGVRCLGLFPKKINFFWTPSLNHLWWVLSCS